jgi:hypothetical protein
MAVTDDDWRLHKNQAAYLTGLTLRRRRWRQSRPDWDHDHCEFCGAKFMDIDDSEVLREGWTDADEYRWICDSCFAEFRNRFAWVVGEALE